MTAENGRAFQAIIQGLIVIDAFQGVKFFAKRVVSSLAEEVVKVFGEYVGV